MIVLFGGWPSRFVAGGRRLTVVRLSSRTHSSVLGSRFAHFKETNHRPFANSNSSETGQGFVSPRRSFVHQQAEFHLFTWRSGPARFRSDPFPTSTDSMRHRVRLPPEATGATPNGVKTNYVLLIEHLEIFNDTKKHLLLGRLVLRATRSLAQVILTLKISHHPTRACSLPTP